MVTTFFLQIFLCMNGSHPCMWQYAMQPIAGLEQCLATGKAAASSWNKGKHPENWIAVGMLCNDKKPQGHDL